MQVLRVIADYPGGVQISEISQRVGMTVDQLAIILIHLEARALIRAYNKSAEIVSG